VCNYEDLTFLVLAPKQGEDDYLSFIEANPADLCVWHENNAERQISTWSGGWNESAGVPLELYEACSIVLTGHDHVYARHTDRTLISGLGGKGIAGSIHGCGACNDWAAIYGQVDGAEFGALFLTFYEERVDGYFKNINGEVIDNFTIKR